MKIFIFSDEDRSSTPASLLLLFKLDKINFDEIDYDLIKSNKTILLFNNN